MRQTSYQPAPPRYKLSILKELGGGAPLSNVDAPVCVFGDPAGPPEEHTQWQAFYPELLTAPFAELTSAKLAAFQL